MLHKAKEIIRIMKELDDKFGTMDDGFKALLLEKELEKLFETPRILGCWVREIDSCTINIGHADYIVTPERTAGNSMNKAIYIHWATTVWSYILSNGDTVSDKSNILNLVKCDEDVLKLYNR